MPVRKDVPVVKPASVAPVAAKPVEVAVARKVRGTLSLKAVPLRPLGPAVAKVEVITAPTRRVWKTEPAPAAPAKPQKSKAELRAEKAAVEKRRAARQEQAPAKGPRGSILGRRGMHGGTGPDVARHQEIVVRVKDE